MKNKEEIEKLIYKFWFNYRYDNGFRLMGTLQYSDERDMLMKAYIKCQEDMNFKINELTEEIEALVKLCKHKDEYIVSLKEKINE